MTAFRYLIIPYFFFFSISNVAQDIPKKWSFAFQLDNRFSSIRNHEITVFGAKVGFQYKKLTRIGLGSSFIINPVYINYFNKKLNQEETNKISFWYFSVYNDWILYKNKKWECFLTEQIGYGKPSFIKEVNDDIVSDVNVDLYVNEISGQVNYKFNSWIGIGTGFGYRNLLNKKSIITSTFDAPIYIAKVIIYPETFFKN
jgi:hypothetical protein